MIAKTIPFQIFQSPLIGANMYALIDGESAFVVDAIRSLEFVERLHGYGVRDVTILLTHEHPDHTYGVPEISCEFDTRIFGTRECSIAVSQERNNRPTLIAMMLIARYGENGRVRARKLLDTWRPYAFSATDILDHGDVIEWHGHSVSVAKTPGHSPGSQCLLFDGEWLFTGDSLIYGSKVITRLPGGDIDAYLASSLPYFKSLPVGINVLPGHGECFVLTEDVLEMVC